MSRADFVVDWDGTCIAERREDGSPYWPGMGDWLPGAVDALNSLSRRGKVVIYSLRCHSFEEDDVTPRPPGAPELEQLRIRRMLDDAGLQHIEVYPNDRGKPPGRFYIDDRAVHFNGDWSDALREVGKRSV